MRTSLIALALLAAAACDAATDDARFAIPRWDGAAPDAGAIVDSSVPAADAGVAPDSSADSSGANAEASAAAVLPDFYVPGTQPGDVPVAALYDSTVCQQCHGGATVPSGPYETWSGSLMANAGRDPLYFAQLTTATQDVPNVGQYCNRCHVPMSVVSGSVVHGDEASLGANDRDGVTCHLCHSMVDPVYDPAFNPSADPYALASVKEVPTHYGNAMFVLDPTGLRRGPFSDSFPPHVATYSRFFDSGDLCGTCHDVGNVRVARRADGTYGYVHAGARSPDGDPHGQFPLERTYTEWKLSAFANGGVDMGGRFGGDGVTVVSTCQDCHMPVTSGMACVFGPSRKAIAKHEFAGASAWSLDAIAAMYPGANQAALARGHDNAVSMLARSATLKLTVTPGSLLVRITNESGHKLPTGHIEGRRVWAHVELFDANGMLAKEYGAYDANAATLDETTTTVYEMTVGLSAQAAATTGLPKGVTTHMALADTIVKDNRIPPRGFAAAAYEAWGAPAVAAAYADGQYWAEQTFVVPTGVASAKVTVYYQTAPSSYVTALRDGNRSDAWGKKLYDVWQATGKSAPIAITSASVAVP
jgi:hypothetical protein